MRKTLAFVALAIAGFTFGFAGCGDDSDGSPSDSGTVTTSEDTTTDDTGARTNEDDGGDDEGGYR